MTNDLNEWVLDILYPERRRAKFHDTLLKFEGYQPNDPKFADVLHKLLRQADDKMLGQIWREWKDGGRKDLSLEVEQEMERRRSSSQNRH